MVGGQWPGIPWSGVAFGRGPRALTVADLVANHTLDWRTTALLWLALERHRSVIVAAGPQMAGKTTTLESLCDLVYPLYTFVETRGRDEDFSTLQGTEPQRTYILVNELSDHLPQYLWGRAARALFEELERGYAFAATMHASTANGVLRQLEDSSLALPVRLVTQLDLVVTLRMFLDGAEPVRRLVSVAVVGLARDGATELSAEPLVTWNPRADRLEPIDTERGHALLERRLQLPWKEIDEEVERREALLPQLLAGSNLGVQGVRQALRTHYQEAHRR